MLFFFIILIPTIAAAITAINGKIKSKGLFIARSVNSLIKVFSIVKYLISLAATILPLLSLKIAFTCHSPKVFG